MILAEVRLALDASAVFGLFKGRPRRFTCHVTCYQDLPSITSMNFSMNFYAPSMIQNLNSLVMLDDAWCLKAQTDLRTEAQNLRR